MKTFYDTRVIIIHLLKTSGYKHLSVERLHDFLAFLYDGLKLRAKLEDYEIFYDIDRGSLERTILYNIDWFRLDEDENRIYLRPTVSITKLAERYPLDEVVSSIVYEYCMKYFKISGGYCNEEDRISSRDTRRFHLLGCFRRFFGTRRKDV